MHHKVWSSGQHGEAIDEYSRTIRRKNVSVLLNYSTVRNFKSTAFDLHMTKLVPHVSVGSFRVCVQVLLIFSDAAFLLHLTCIMCLTQT